MIPSTLARDCSRDVTHILNYVFAVLPDNSTLTFPWNGCYRINGTLRISGKNGLTVDGRNSSFKAMTDGSELPAREARTRAQFLVHKSSNVTIKYVKAYGANIYAGLNDLALPVGSLIGASLIGFALAVVALRHTVKE